jgi:ribosomal protein L15E
MAAIVVRIGATYAATLSLRALFRTVRLSDGYWVGSDKTYKFFNLVHI